MKAASSRCENCSNLIACCSCGVIAKVWREARMRLGPIRMCPQPLEAITPPAGALSKIHAKLQRLCDRRCVSLKRPTRYRDLWMGQEGRCNTPCPFESSSQTGNTRPVENVDF